MPIYRSPLGLAADPSFTGTYAGLQLTPATSRFIRRAVGNVRSGTADAKILCVGDSTTNNFGPTGGPSKSYPSLLVDILNKHVTTANGLAIPQSWLTPNYDTRWTIGTGWVADNRLAWGTNSCWRAPSGTLGNLVYADSRVTCDKYDVYYVVNPGLGTLTITATGGTPVVQSTAGTQGLAKVTVTAAAAATSNTLTITPSGGDVYVFGVEPWLSTTKTLRVGNAGVNGTAVVRDWMNNGLAAAWNSVNCIKAYAPDLTVIMLGINGTVIPETASGVAAGITTLAQAAAVSGDVIIIPMVPPTSGAVAGVVANYPAYYAAEKALSVTYPVIDLQSRWISGDQANTDNLMADTLHPNAIGCADIAQAVGSWITTF